MRLNRLNFGTKLESMNMERRQTGTKKEIQPKAPDDVDCKLLFVTACNFGLINATDIFKKVSKLSPNSSTNYMFVCYLFGY